MTIYEASYGKFCNDFASKSEAIAAVEAIGEGRIVTFHRGHDGMDRSGAMIVYRDGAWIGVDISL